MTAIANVPVSNGGSPAAASTRTSGRNAPATTPADESANVPGDARAGVASSSASTSTGANGPSVPATSTLAGAITAGLREAMRRDERVILLGEDIGPLGGVFRVTAGLQDEFGADRVRDTPLAESGIVGTAIGLAMGGYLPVVEIQFDGFVFPAFDQITTQLAKLHYRSQGDLRVPVVIRIPYGGGIGAIEHHSESPEAYFAHTAGLRVISPASPADAFAMIQQAIACPDPVVFLEPKARYWSKGPLPAESVLLDDDALQSARTLRAGTDVTLAGYGPTVANLLEAAIACERDGVSAEVIDLRSISPLDVGTVAASVRRTGRLVIAHEAPTTYGVGAELAARVTEECFYSLQAPVRRVGGYHTPYPANAHEHEYLPGVDRIIDAVSRVIEE